MYKKYALSLVVVLLGVTFFSGCGVKDEKTRLKEAAIEMMCTIAKPLMEKMKTMDPNDEASMTAFTEESGKAQTKMLEVAKKYGFESQEAFEAAGEKYSKEENKEYDKNFENDVKSAVKSSCGFDMDETPGF